MEMLTAKWLKDIDFENYTTSVPVFVTFIGMPLT